MRVKRNSLVFMLLHWTESVAAGFPEFAESTGVYYLVSCFLISCSSRCRALVTFG